MKKLALTSLSLLTLIGCSSPMTTQQAKQKYLDILCPSMQLLQENDYKFNDEIDKLFATHNDKIKSVKNWPDSIKEDIIIAFTDTPKLPSIFDPEYTYKKLDIDAKEAKRDLARKNIFNKLGLRENNNTEPDKLIGVCVDWEGYVKK